MNGSLKHIGLQVVQKDLLPFYQEVFKMEFQSTFILSKDDSYKIFNKEQVVSIIYAKSEFCDFELFVVEEAPLKISFAHLCIELDQPLLFANTASGKGYEVILREKENKSKTYFIKDSNRNIFEIKQAN
ncbi:MAG: hypothetical protein WCQ86_03715 [Bacteroidaceae bacterium]